MLKPNILLIAAGLFVSHATWSQKKFNLSVFTGSGLSFFGGPGAVSSSKSYFNEQPFPNDYHSIADPYGKKPYLNFLAGLEVDLVMSKWILAVSSQYEHSGGSLNYDSIISPSGNKKVSGKYSRNYEFISINPQVGRIIVQKKITFALRTGIDYTSKLDRGLQFGWTDQSGQKYEAGYDGDEPEINDVRITFAAIVAMKRWGIAITYKHGIANYNPSGANAYSRLLQFRLQYTFLSKRI